MIGKILPGKPVRDKTQPRTNNLWLSVSKIKTFKQCKAKYRYAYIKYIKVDKSWDHLNFGSVLHGALEYFHQFLLDGDSDDIHTIMQKAFKKILLEYKGKLDKEQKKEAFDILTKYLFVYDSLLKNNKLPNVLSVEDDFYIDIDGIIFNGKVDRIQQDYDGIVNILDYKTNKKKVSLKYDKFQLLAYAYYLFLKDPNLNHIRSSYLLLRHDFEEIKVEYKRDDVSEFEEKMLSIRSSIESEKIWRPQPSPLCPYCDYLEICDEGRRSLNKRPNIVLGRDDEETW